VRYNHRAIIPSTPLTFGDSPSCELASKYSGREGG